MRHEEVPLDWIRVEGRAREDLGDIEGLAESFKRLDSMGKPVGLIEPIVVDTSYRLIAGGRRHAAAVRAGLEKVPCIIRDVRNKVDALELELLENTQRKDMTWQERALLEKRIYDIKAENNPEWSNRKQAAMLDVSPESVNRRIQLAEAFDLLPELKEYSTEDEAWKTLKRLEENFVLKEIINKAPEAVKEARRWATDHYIVGDALQGMLQVEPGVADFAEVDPPYAVELITEKKSRNKSRKAHSSYNEVDPDEYEAFYKAAAEQVYRILRPNAFAVFWFGPTWHAETLSILREVGFNVPDIPAVWTKGAVGQTASPDTMFGSCYEPFWLARKGTPKLAKPGRSNVFAFNPVAPAKKLHATEKPLPLLVDILSSIIQPGSVILVPFLGSGVTLRAAYKLGHTGWGYDLDQANKDNFLRRVYEDEEPEEVDPEKDAAE